MIPSFARSTATALLAALLTFSAATQAQVIYTETFTGLTGQYDAATPNVLDLGELELSFQTISGTPQARVRFGQPFTGLGSDVAVLDRNPNAAPNSNSSLVITLDLSNYNVATDVITLDYRYNTHDDEAQGVTPPVDERDVIYVRGNNALPWVQVHDWCINPNGDCASKGVWTPVVGVNLSAALFGAGQAFGATTQIRISQYDNSPATSLTLSDGASFDDIVLQCAGPCDPAPPTGGLTGVVFRDDNLNGVQDGLEPPIPGVEVELIGPGCWPCTATTNAGGIYTFPVVRAGNHNLEVDTRTVPSGATRTVPVGFPLPIAVAAGPIVAGPNIGYAYGFLSGKVYRDLDGDGTLGGSDTGIPGVDVSITGPSCSPCSTVTNATGDYTLTGLGAYSLDIDTSGLPSGSVLTEPGALPVAHALASGVTVPQNVGHRTGTVAGLVFSDANGNGTLDAGEGFLNGVNVELTGPNCAPCAQASNLGGRYFFRGLQDSNYSLDVTGPPAGFTRTTPAALPTNVALLGGDVDSAPDIGYNADLIAACNPTTGLGGRVVREWQIDGALQTGNQVSDYSAIPSAVPGDFTEDLPLGGCTDALGPNSQCIETFVGGNNYADLGMDFMPLREEEPGLSGLTVSFYGPNNVFLGSTATGADGSWAFLPGGANGDPVTVEITGWDSTFSSGPRGLSNSTSVIHTTVGTCGLDFTVAKPSDHCTANPDLGLSCFVGDATAAGTTITATDTLIRLPWQDGQPFVVETQRPAAAGGGTIPEPPGSVGFNWLGNDFDEEYLPPPAPNKAVVADKNAIGNVFGLAWDARRGALYSAAIFKRNAPVTLAGAREVLGGIFKDDALWLDIGDPLGLNQTVHQGYNCDVDGDLLVDDLCVNDVGFNGLGDLEIADNGQELYAVNLATQQILAIPFDTAGNPDTGNVRYYQAPEPTACNTDNPGGFSRTRAPFALAYHEGELFVGVTCTQNINAGAGFGPVDLTGATAGPHGFVFRFDPSNPPAAPAYQLVLSVDLTYPKFFYTEGYVVAGPIFFGDDGYSGLSNHKNWGGQTAIIDYLNSSSGGYTGSTPVDNLPDPNNVCGTINNDATTGNYYMPWLTDLEIDVRADGRDDLVLGVRNRAMDLFVFGGCTNGGALIRACESGIDTLTWTEETRGIASTCGGRSPGTGPGNTRYDAPFKPGTPGFFMDIGAEGRFGNGTLAAIAGFSELAAPATDNITNLSTSGVSWLSTINGNHQRSTTLLSELLLNVAWTGLGKAPNFGDAEAMCPPAPLEIGNYVWFDSNNNGIQDPDETAVSGATLELYVDTDGNGQLSVAEYAAPAVATKITDGSGQFSFTVADGVTYDTDYVLVARQIGPLIGSTDATANAGGTDTRDSDGVAQPAGVIGTAFSTGAPGETQQQLDFGFRAPTGYDMALVYDYISDNSADGQANDGRVKVGDEVTYRVTVSNQGGDPITNPQFRAFVGGEFSSFILADNPAGNTSGTVLPYGFSTLGDHGLATVTGALGSTQSMSFDLTLTVATSTQGCIDAYAEVYADDGSDADSQPESEELDDNADPLVDNVTDNSGGDEDDHDVAQVCVVGGGIGDYVWHDANRDGVQNGGESGIANVTLNLYEDDGNSVLDGGDTLVDTTTTDSGGLYTFRDLDLVDYHVDLDELTLPAGFVATAGTDDSHGVITLTANEFYDLADFGYAPGNSVLGDFIWYDSDSDGLQDPGEVGIPNVQVTVTGPGPYNQIATTGPDGKYLVTGITTSGTYNAAVTTATLPAGVNTLATNIGEPPPNIADENYIVTAGIDFLSADFGFDGGSLGSIGDYVWRDINQDGVQDAGEPGIANVTLSVFDAGSNLVASMATDANGNYDFVGLTAGTYTVLVTDVYGQTQDLVLCAGSSPTAGIPIVGGTDHNDADFGFCTDAGQGSVGNLVFLDEDGDGVFTPGIDNGVELVTVELWRDENANCTLETGTDTFLRTTETDTAGRYAFQTLPVPIDYLTRVAPTESVVAGFSLTIGAVGVDENSQASPHCSQLTAIAPADPVADFGHEAGTPFQICGTVFFDDDADGTQDLPEDEGQINGTLTLYRDLDADGIIDSTDPVFGVKTTDANGDYCFGGLPGGGSDWLIESNVAGTSVSGGTQTTQLATNGIEPAEILAADVLDQDFGYTLPATLALISDFSVLEVGGQIVVEWRTAHEVGTLGFFLYRFDEQDWVWKQLNRSMLLSGDEGRGATYRFVDDRAQLSTLMRYSLIEIEVGGGERTYGPFYLNPEAQRFDGFDIPEAGFEAIPHLPDPHDLERRREREAELDTLGRASATVGELVRLTAQNAGVLTLDSSTIADRLGISQTAAEDHIENGTLRLTTDGSEVAWWAEGLSRILLFVDDQDSQFTRERDFFLEIASGTQAAQQVVAQAPPSSGATFEYTATLEDQVFAGTAAVQDPNQEFWFWKALAAGQPSGDELVQFDLPTPLAGSGGTLELYLFGATSTPRQPDHRLRVELNGIELTTLSWDGSGSRSFQIPIPAVPEALEDTGNELRLTALLPDEVPYGVIYLDRFEITYDRLYRADDGRLRFRATANGPITAAGFSNPDLVLLDISDVQNPIRLSGAASDDLDGRRLSFMATDNHEYLVLDRAAIEWAEARGIESLGTGLEDGAEYVVIAPDHLMSSAMDLADLRASSGLSSRAIDLESIFDQYASGEPTPSAVIDFLADAYATWQEKPRFVALIGKGTVDYQNALGVGDNLLPPKLYGTPSGLYASDLAFGDVDDDGRPEIAVGRIPAATLEELDLYIEKLTLWETGLASQADRLLWLSDNPDAAGSFAQDASALAELLPLGLTRQDISLATTGLSEAKQSLENGLESGAYWLNYVGHGGGERFAAEGLLTASDVFAAGPSQGQIPIVSALTCAVNRFEVSGFTSLGEALVLDPDGGAIAVFAPTGLSNNASAQKIGQSILTQAFGGAETLGEAVKDALRSPQVDPDLGRVYLLLGDPALQLPQQLLDHVLMKGDFEVGTTDEWSLVN